MTTISRTDGCHLLRDPRIERRPHRPPLLHVNNETLHVQGFAGGTVPPRLRIPTMGDHVAFIVAATDSVALVSLVTFRGGIAAIGVAFIGEGDCEAPGE